MVQAGTLTPEDLEASAGQALAHLEAHAWFDGRDEAHDALAQSVAFGDRLGQVVFVLGAATGPHVVEGDDGAPGRGDQGAAVVGDLGGGGLGRGREVLERHPLGPQVATRAVLFEQGGQMSLEDHPVVHGQRAGDLPLVKLLERAHGDLLENPSRGSARQVWIHRHGRRQRAGWARGHRFTRTGPALPARHRLVPETGGAGRHGRRRGDDPQPS
jgi:hypothetical protein